MRAKVRYGRIVGLIDCLIVELLKLPVYCVKAWLALEKPALKQLNNVAIQQSDHFR
jgi:hypothetical protein